MAGLVVQFLFYLHLILEVNLLEKYVNLLIRVSMGIKILNKLVVLDWGGS